MSITVTEAQQLSSRLEDLKEYIRKDIEDLKDKSKEDIKEVKELLQDHLTNCHNDMAANTKKIENLEEHKNKAQGAIWMIGFMVTLITLYLLVKGVTS